MTELKELPSVEIADRRIDWIDRQYVESILRSQQFVPAVVDDNPGSIILPATLIVAGVKLETKGI